jgi:hypothetical protein
LNIWDFGGQQIFHQTHRYFLTERCIYLVVLERRRQDSRDVVYTWLDTIASRAPNSPVVVVINKCDDGKHDLDVDFDRLRREYPEIVDVLKVSCQGDPSLRPGDDRLPNASLVALRDVLARLLAEDDRLDSVRRPVPAAWVRVRDEVRQLAGREQVLGVDRYVQLCLGHGDSNLRVVDPDEQRALLRFLHQIGAVVAHGLTEETTNLSGLTLLDPNWLTDAVYARRADGTVKEHGAVFDRTLLGQLLRRDRYRAEQYPDDRLDFIIDMMQRPEFALAYRLPGPTDPPRFLLPLALTPTAPGAISGWDPESLRLRFRYEQLPEALPAQFQVHAHQHFGDDPARWRTGCTLQIHGCPVLVDGQPARKRIEVHVAGPVERRPDALAVVRSLFQLVHAGFPESKPKERIPLPQSIDADVSFGHLRHLEREEGLDHEFRPEGAVRRYAVGELLRGVHDDRHDTTTQRGGVTIINKGHSSGIVVSGANSDVGYPSPIAPGRDDGEGKPGGLIDRVDVRSGAGGAVGATLGFTSTALYLLGRGKGWPMETFLEGSGIGAVAGGALGALSALFASRSKHEQA